MTTSISPSSQMFLSNLQQIQNRISRAERDMSAGVRVMVASDAPDQIAGILQLRAQITSVEQTQKNLSSVTPQIMSGEEAIQQAIQVLDTATTLATAAATSTSTAGQRLDEVPQVKGILQQLVSLSQIVVNGQYIFSGDQGDQPSYVMNDAGDGFRQTIHPGPPGQVLDANGVAFSIGLTAAQIFDDRDAGGNPTAANVFTAITGLMTALQNNDSTGIQAALGNIQAASAHLNNQSSFYGAAQNNVTAAGRSAGTTLIQLQQQLSTEQDTDAVQAAIDLQTALNAEQAAMAAQAQNKPQSLFNYLG